MERTHKVISRHFREHEDRFAPNLYFAGALRRFSGVMKVLVIYEQNFAVAIREWYWNWFVLLYQPTGCRLSIINPSTTVPNGIIREPRHSQFCAGYNLIAITLNCLQKLFKALTIFGVFNVWLWG